MSDEIKNEPYVKSVELDNFAMALEYCIRETQKAIRAEIERRKRER